ncbi:Rad2 nuclease [Puccinia graminis f. sp. tritici]|uniref:Rad2 nuclease n=1 Tax=Puccinia graminis f. sp. tritici TaxID=56615 RepID=A0A5B0Q5K6_PUCGR|nr:Rad2 nuclease [Puccinia graminis f. sp. tritici]
MGIQGLLPFLRSIQRESHLKNWAGKTLAIDGYVWLHRGAYHCAQELCLGNPTTKHVDYFVQKIHLLHRFGVSAYVVFDGDHLPSKKVTEDDRENRRRIALANAQKLLAQGDQKRAREEFVKAVDVTPRLAHDVILALRSMGVKYVVAPYEADAQLRYLEMKGEVHGIITEDSDLLVYGARNVLFKMDPSGHCIHICRDELGQVDDKRMGLWDERQFRQMAMLSGCDYLSSIPGLGIKKAHDLIRRHQTAERAIKATRLDGKLPVPPKYEQSFREAELTFEHQFVYDPTTRTMIPLTPLPESPPSPQALAGCGEKWPDQIAIDVAEGRVDPMTKEAFSAQPSTLKHLPPLHQLKTTIPKQLAPSRPALSSSGKQSTLNQFAFKSSSSNSKTVSSTPVRPSIRESPTNPQVSKSITPVNGKPSKFFECQPSKQPNSICPSPPEADSESQGYIATQTTIEDLPAEDAVPLTQESWDAISELSTDDSVDPKVDNLGRDIEFEKLIGEDLPSSQMHDPSTAPLISRSSSSTGSNKENCQPVFTDEQLDSSFCPSSSLEITNQARQDLSDGFISSSQPEECELTITKPRVTIITPNNHHSIAEVINGRRVSEPIPRQTRQLPLSSDPIPSSDDEEDAQIRVMDTGLNRRKAVQSTFQSHQPSKRICRGFVQTPSSKLSTVAKRSASTTAPPDEEISPSLARVASGIRNRFTYTKPSASEKRPPIGKPKLFDFSKNHNDQHQDHHLNEKTRAPQRPSSHRKSCQLPLGSSTSTTLNDVPDPAPPSKQQQTESHIDSFQAHLPFKRQPSSRKPSSHKPSLGSSSSAPPPTTTPATSNKLSMFMFKGFVDQNSNPV